MLPPSVNDSGCAFEIRGDRSIRYGLGALKGLGRNVADLIIAVRADGPFTDIDDFCERVYSHKVGRRALEALIKAGAMDDFGFNRPTLLQRLPASIGLAEQAAQARESGQVDLFGASADDSDTGAPRAAIKSVADWGLRQRLEAERESLGLYLSGHPFDPYRLDGPFISSGAIGDLLSVKPPAASTDKPWSGGRNCSIAGIVTGLRRRAGRVTFDLDDGDNRIEVTLFQEAFDRYRHLLTANAVVMISGKIRFDDFIDAWRLNGKDVVDIDRAIEARATKLIIRWREADFGRIDADRLKQVLEPYRPGACDVSLFVIRDDAQFRMLLGADWAVRPSADLRDQLAELVGQDGYRFVYRGASAA